jgi:hypothetical protein
MDWGKPQTSAVASGKPVQKISIKRNDGAVAGMWGTQILLFKAHVCIFI